ncbi:hypothetical protein OC889_004722, partial [Salmonella enterica]|nr:hypothetical protein [Salmonella enterica]
IRYNTVTVQVNGANVGTQYHAAWSPDITLDRSNAPAYSDADVNRIIKSCSADLVVDTSTPDNWKVFTTTQDFVGTHEFECGQDTQTALRPKVKYTAQLLPDVTVHRVGTKLPDDWKQYGGSIESSDSAGWKGRSGTATRSVSRGVTGAAMELPRRTYIGRRINVVTQDASGATTGDKLIVPYAVGLLTQWYTGKNASYTPNVPSGFTVTVKGSKMTGYPVAMQLDVKMYVYKTASELITGIFSLHDITRSTIINTQSIDMQTDLKGLMQLYAAEGIDPGNGYMYTDAAEETVRAYTEWGGNGYQMSVRLLTDEHAQGEGNFGNDNNVSNPHYLHIRF